MGRAKIRRPDCCAAQHPSCLLSRHANGDRGHSLSPIQGSSNIWLQDFYSSFAGACPLGNDDYYVLPYAYPICISWHVKKFYIYLHLKTSTLHELHISVL